MHHAGPNEMRCNLTAQPIRGVLTLNGAQVHGLRHRGQIVWVGLDVHWHAKHLLHSWLLQQAGQHAANAAPCLPTGSE